MQLTNAPTVEQFPHVLDAFQDERIERYLPAADKSLEDAFRLYLWNCALCEAFYVPLQVGEIVCRNAIHKRLLERWGDKWFEHPSLGSRLSMSGRDELDHVLMEERAQHGARFNAHHLVSGLSFGFWQHMLTKRYDRPLWDTGLRTSFPLLPRAMGRQEVHDRIESIRRWRNRIAHHKAIFDKAPSAKYQETLQFIRWVSDEVADWLASASKVTAAIDLRPL